MSSRSEARRKGGDEERKVKEGRETYSSLSWSSRPLVVGISSGGGEVTTLGNRVLSLGRRRKTRKRGGKSATRGSLDE